VSPNDLGGALVLDRPRRAAPPDAIAPHTAGGSARRPDLDVLLGRAAPDRLAVAVLAYLTLPGLLFLAGWTEPWAGLGAGLAALAALVLAPGWRGGEARWPFGVGTTLVCLALGLAWAGATGAHHLVYSTADWQIRDAVLRDLSAGPWPVAYTQGGADGPQWLLRAPLGFFLPAGLVGRVFGFAAAQAALWAWAGLGLGLVLALLATLGRALDPRRPTRAFAVLAVVFALFHGLDVLPNLWLDGRAGAGALAAWGRGGEWWGRLFQYPGHVTALLWAPNHALPAWLAALLLLRHGRRPEFVRGVALPLAAAAFWSPVAAAGAAVLAAAGLLRRGSRGRGVATRSAPGGAEAPGDAGLRAALAAPANWLAVVFAVPLCLYLVAGSGAVPHGLLVASHPPAEALGRWLLLLAVEVLPWAALAVVLVRGGRLFGASVAILCLLPAYVFGPGNEMTSRGGVAPLAVLAVVVGAALLAPAGPDRGRRLARAGLLACAALAAAGSAMEGSLLVARDPWPASERCSVPEAARQSVFQGSTNWSHYLAPWPDERLEGWMEEPEERPVPPPARSPRCWPRGGA
jgi:hypothetical protein